MTNAIYQRCNAPKHCIPELYSVNCMSDPVNHSQENDRMYGLTPSLSTPKLPSSNVTSEFVYASMKKRAERNILGVYPFEGKLKPLNDALLSRKLASSTSLELDSTADKDHLILSLQKRIIKLEDELHHTRRYIGTMEKKNEQLRSRRVFVENTLRERQILLQELGQNARMKQIQVDKLSNRCAAANEKLLMLTSTCASNGENNMTMEQQMTLIKTLSKENHDFDRKLRNFEQRYRQDKTRIATQERLISDLHDELESLQVESSGNGEVLVHKERNEEVQIASGNSKMHFSSSYKKILQSGQHIDSRMLSILEKTDPHDSLSSALQLAVLLKKWLQSCMDLPCSLDVSKMMQRLLQRTCTLLHCQYAAYFEIDSERAMGRHSNEHGQVCWPLDVDKGFVGYTAKHRKPLNVPKALEDLRYHAACDTLSGTKSKEVLCVPIMSQNCSKSTESVVGVLRIWNSLHRKPFTLVEQIVATFLAIEAGITSAQCKEQSHYERNKDVALRLLRFPAELAKKCGSDLELKSHSIDEQLLIHSERFCAEILGSGNVRIFLLDRRQAGHLWYVNAKHRNGESRLFTQKMSVKAGSSLCEVMIQRQGREICMVKDPQKKPCYNDVVDLEPGTSGIVLAPISSIWEPMLLLGVIQITRDAPVHFDQSQNEIETSWRDEFTIEVLELFCGMLAGVIHQM